MTYTPEVSAMILTAIGSILLANNGYADIGPRADVADAVRTAGFVVIASTNIHGRPTYRGFTKAAQASLAAEHAANGAAGYAVSTYKPVRASADLPDYEGAILARNDRHLFA